MSNSKELFFFPLNTYLFKPDNILNKLVSIFGWRSFTCYEALQTLESTQPWRLFFQKKLKSILKIGKVVIRSQHRELSSFNPQIAKFTVKTKEQW